jgi:hypothetical protein
MERGGADRICSGGVLFTNGDGHSGSSRCRLRERERRVRVKWLGFSKEGLTGFWF